jgi:IS5 family transposase
LSDPKLERALILWLDLMLICGLPLHGKIPDATINF